MDTVLLNPDAKALLKTLTSALKSANRKITAALKVTLSESVVATAIRGVLKKPEGQRYWRQGQGRTSYHKRAVVVLAWWTDSIGRKHVRIAGEPCDFDCLIHKSNPKGYPALWHVYPNSCVKIGKHWKDMLLVCGCGAVGTESSIAWMGERCGPCHDRAEERGAVPPSAMLPGCGAVAPTPDGRAIIHYAHDELIHHDLTTGETQRVETQFREITSYTFHPTRPECYVVQEGGRTKWNWTTGKSIKKKDAYGAMTLSPDGRWCSLGRSEFRPIEWDKRGDPLGEKIVLPKVSRSHPFLPKNTYLGPPYFSGSFALDGRWIAGKHTGGLDAVELSSQTTTYLRGTEFAHHDGSSLFQKVIHDIHGPTERVLVGFTNGEYGSYGTLRVGSLTGTDAWEELNLEFDDREGLPPDLRFTPDGEWIVYPGPNSIRFFPLDGSGQQEVTFGLPLQNEELHAVSFSPDGEWLYASMLFQTGTVGTGMIRRLPWRTLLALQD